MSTRGRGYVENKMSVNAVRAYANDEKPISKWRKSEFMEIIENDFDIRVKSVKGSYKNFLKESGKHHTGMFYNYTMFYEIDFDLVEEELGKSIKTYTEEEIEEMDKAKELAREEYKKRKIQRKADMIQEIMLAEKNVRISKAGNEVLEIYINEEMILWNKCYISSDERKEIAKLVGCENAITVDFIREGE